MRQRKSQPPEQWGSKIASYQRFLEAQSKARARAAEQRRETDPIPAETEREERIARVRERIRQGFYSRPEVLDLLAVRLLASLPEPEATEETPSTR